MKPVLFVIFGIPFPSYGVFFAIGFIATFVWGYFEAKRVGLDAEKALDVGFWYTVGVIIGSRILYVIVEWDYFRNVPWEALRIWNGGMVLYGGVFGGFVAAYIAASVLRVETGKIADVISQAAPIGLILGRVGCLLNGCCYGRPTSLPWAITYTRQDSMANAVMGKPLHPAPIYEIIILSVIFITLAVWSRRKRFDWQMFWVFYILYSAGRFIVEFYRGDPRGWVEEPVLSRVIVPLLHEQTFSGLAGGGFFSMPYLSTSQFISVFIFIVSLSGYFISSRRARKKKAQEGSGNLRSGEERVKN